MKGFFILSILLTVFEIAFSQRKIQGKVISAKDSVPLAGCNVLIKDTNLFTTTDSNWNF